MFLMAVTIRRMWNIVLHLRYFNDIRKCIALKSKNQFKHFKFILRTIYSKKREQIFCS